MSSIAEARSLRNPDIDALRGLSILLVVLHHVGLRVPLRRGVLAGVVPAGVLEALNYEGYEAVFIFFVISGFLITTNALSRWGELQRISLRAFYARRFARIAPCLVLLIAVLSLLHACGAEGYVIVHPGQSLRGAVIAALGLHLNWYEGRTGYLPAGWDVLWSLSIEEVFYLGFPLACRAVRSRRLFVAGLSFLAASLPFALHRLALQHNEIWQEKAYLPGMAAIAMGILAALVAARPQLRARLPLYILGWAALGLVLLAETSVWRVLHHGTLLLLTAATGCLLVAMRWRSLERVRPPRWLGWLRGMGRLSYEIYLTHMFVVLGFVRAFTAAHGDIRLGVLWYAPVVALCFALGYAAARLVSGPSEALARSLLLPERAPAGVPWEGGVS